MAAAIAVVLASAACGSAPVAPAAGRQGLALGFLGDSAPKTSSGGKKGAELAVEEYNRHADSTYRVSLKAETIDGSAPDAARGADQVSKTERLIGVVGELSDAGSQAAALVLDKAGIPFLTTSTGGEAPPGAKSFRRLVAPAVQQGKALGLYANRTFPAGPALVMHDETPVGNDFSAGLKSAFDTAKRPIPRFERINPKTDLEGLAGSIAFDPPMILVFAGEGGLGARFIEESRKAGYKGPIVVSPGILQAKPSGVADGVITSSPIADPADRGGADFRARYRARFGSKPPPLALEAYEGASMLLEAIEEVEPKPKELIEFLRFNRSFLGDSKDYEYDEKGDLKSLVVWLYQSKAGAWTFTGRSPAAARSR